MSNDKVNETNNKKAFIKLETISYDDCCGGDCGEACICYDDFDECCGGESENCKCAQ